MSGLRGSLEEGEGAVEADALPAQGSEHAGSRMRVEATLLFPRERVDRSWRDGVVFRISR